MLRILQRVFGRDAHAQSEQAFRIAIERARTIQRLGYDIGFSFLPRFYDTPFLYVCDGRLGPQKLTGVGFDCFSRSDAFIKTLSETLERAIWNGDMLYWKEGSVRGTSNSLNAPALELANLSGFSDAQRHMSKGLTFDATTEFLWSRGVRLKDGTPLYVPAQLVSGKYTADMSGKEPLLRIPNSNGLATHESFDEAARRGLLELIERDAFMITFHNMISPPRIDPASITDKRAGSIIAQIQKYGFKLDILSLPTDMPVTVICCLLRDESGAGPSLAVGARAGEDPTEAIIGALTEALGVYYLARTLKLYKEPTPERVLSAIERIALWAKPENTPTLSWLWEGTMGTMPKSRKRMSAKKLAASAEQKGCSIAAIAMIPPKLQKLGLHSVCVVSPELQPLNLDSEPPYLGGVRLRSVPESLGYTAKDAPPPYPHPFP